MEKFKEKKIVTVLTYLLTASFVSFIVLFGIGMFHTKLLLPAFINIISVFAIAVLILLLETRDKYTARLLEYFRNKLSCAETLEEHIEMLNEFESLCVENGRYILSFHNDLRDIHKQLGTKIALLERINSKN